MPLLYRNRGNYKRIDSPPYEMAKNAGESRIPVSRPVRPSYLSKPKIVGLTKHNNSGSTSVVNSIGNNKRSTLYSGCLPLVEHENIITPQTPREWAFGATFTSTPSDKLTDATFNTSSLWNFKDNDTQHELSLQRKEEKSFSKYYNQVSMLDDVGDSCLLDVSIASTFNDTTNSLSAAHQYLSLNTQNSFDHDESLGILTPDQMTDFTVLLGCSRTPSCENISRQAAGTTSSSSRVSRATDLPFNGDVELHDDIICERSPSLEELPLDPKPLIECKLLLTDQTIDSATTTTTITTVTSGAATSTAHLPMSFVTSVTSITSLEAGYQGDGENSRPASRGPDPPAVPPGNLPGNLPASCHPCRVQDPMTDSDFFTESDADAHEDIGRGDRRAQVIDGTLFCAPVGRRCPSFTGEEMDSSGIYSDLDKRQDERYNMEEQLMSEDHTPDTADTGDTVDTQMSQRREKSLILLPETPQVIMNFMQVSKSPDIVNDITPETHEITVIHVAKESTSRSINSKTLLTNKSDSATLKKYKMPKKNVASKIKAMIESDVKEDTSSSSSIKEPSRRILRAPRKSGRWDAVMSKIEASKNEQRLRSPRKEIKSRISQTLTAAATTAISSSSSSAVSSASSTSAATVASAKRLNGNTNNNLSKDKRRSRVRQDVSSPMEETARSSVRSSISDLSSAPSKITAPNCVMGQQGSKGRTAPVRADLVRESKIGFGSLKRERSPVTVNQQRRVLNGRNTLKSRTTNNETKKACTLDLSPLNLDKSPTPTRKLSSVRRTTVLNNVCNNAEKQLQNGSALVAKDRGTKEVRASPVISPRIPIEYRHQEAQTEDNIINCDLNQSKCAQDTIQALCLTIQYLTRQLDECSTTTQAELRHLTMTRVNLEEKLKDERENHQKTLEELCTQLETSYAVRINELENALEHEQNDFDKRLKSSVDKLMNEHETTIDRLKMEYSMELQSKEQYWHNKYLALSKLENDKEFQTIRNEYESLKLCLKPILVMKNRVIAKLKLDISNLQQQVEDKNKLQKQIDEMKQKIKKNNDIKEMNNGIVNNDLCESSDIIDCGSLTGNDQIATLRAEIWSLRSVLEIRSQENSTMRSENEMLRRDCEGKDQLEQRVESLEARCEDLKAQLQGKESYERQMSHQNEILLGSFHEISKHNARLTQRNEELQWRLRQKNEVVSVLANQLATPTPRLSRSLGPEHIDHSIIADKNSQPTSSSMIKFMVQKGDSVSWTLEIDESCDPLPNTDTVSPAVSRQNSLRRPLRKSLDVRARSKSVSTSDVVNRSNDIWSPSYNSTPVISRRRPRSDPSSSVIGASSANSVTDVETSSGARPQEAGGEAMISEETSATSSEDESSGSSDIARLSMDFGWENTVE